MALGALNILCNRDIKILPWLLFKLRMCTFGQQLWLNSSRDPRLDPRFKSSHRQFLFTISYIKNCTEKTKMRKKGPGMAHLENIVARLLIGADKIC